MKYLNFILWSILAISSTGCVVMSLNKRVVFKEGERIPVKFESAEASSIFF